MPCGGSVAGLVFFKNREVTLVATLSTARLARLAECKAVNLVVVDLLPTVGFSTPARLAQSAERKVLNFVVVGSSST